MFNINDVIVYNNTTDEYKIVWENDSSYVAINVDTGYPITIEKSDNRWREPNPLVGERYQPVDRATSCGYAIFHVVYVDDERNRAVVVWTSNNDIKTGPISTVGMSFDYIKHHLRKIVR